MIDYDKEQERLKGLIKQTGAKSAWSGLDAKTFPFKLITCLKFEDGTQKYITSSSLQLFKMEG